MISREAITEAATGYHTSDFNIAREYSQHLFLACLYKRPNANGLLFKGGTALRVCYKSPRFSEDLDFSSFGLTKEQIEALFLGALSDIERQGFSIELHEKSHETSGGYYGEARLRVYEHNVTLEINVNSKPGELRGEHRTIIGGFAPNYSLLMLPETILVGEKLQALRSRKKLRDFYDLYFMLRAGLITIGMRQEIRDLVPLVEATTIDFQQELAVFLPQDYHSIIRDFKNTLLSELRRNIGS